MANTWGDSPIHPIIERPDRYQIIGLYYHHNPEDQRDSYIDMTLKHENTIRRLRFTRPSSLKIETGFPQPTHGMIILDIRHRQWQALGIEVADFEASNGAVTFYAADVIDLDRQINGD